MNKRTIYRVKKFIPFECPKCQNSFAKANDDFILLLGDIVNGSKMPRAYNLHDVIICKECDNFTARVLIEERNVFEEKEAKRLVNEDGFTTIDIGTAGGEFTEKELRIVHALGHGIKVLDNDQRKNYFIIPLNKENKDGSAEKDSEQTG